MRRSTLLRAVLAAALLGPAAQASAAVTSSAITSPADPAFRTYDADLGAGAAENRLVVTGTARATAPGTDRVDVRCFWTDSGGSLRANTLALRVPLAADGSFSVGADPATLADNPFGEGTRDDAQGVQTCRLRATPAAASLAALDTSALPEFAGPRINVARFGSSTLGVRGGGTVTVDYGVGAGGLRGQVEWSSRCGAFSFRPFVNAAALSPALFPNWDCVRALLPPDAGDGESQVEVDGIPAYTGSSAPSLDFDGNGTAERPTGASGLEVSYRRDPASGAVTTVERSQLQRCATPVVPPTTTSCTDLVGLGVELERTTTFDDDGLQTTVVDVLRSTDGRAHGVSLRPEQYVVFDNDPVFRFPGEDAFAPHGPGDQPALGPAGVPASTFTRDAITPDTPRQGTGAETWDVAPADVRFFGEDYQYLERTELGVPAGGASSTSRVFRVARTLGEAEAGARAAEVRLTPPPPPAPPVVAPPPPAAPAPVRRCRVPGLGRGSLYGTARSKLKRAGCAVGKVRRVRSSTRKGRVVRTRPPAGRFLPLGTRVAIDLSDGKAKKARKPARRKTTKRPARSRAAQAAGASATPPAALRNAPRWAPAR